MLSLVWPGSVQRHANMQNLYSKRPSAVRPHLLPVSAGHRRSQFQKKPFMLRLREASSRPRLCAACDVAQHPRISESTRGPCTAGNECDSRHDCEERALSIRITTHPTSSYLVVHLNQDKTPLVELVQAFDAALDKLKQVSISRQQLNNARRRQTQMVLHLWATPNPEFSG